MLGHATEAVVITVIVLFAVLLGFVQEYRAERAIEALREMAAPTASVLRDGEPVEIPAREVVPGDVLLLAAGDRAPADGRVSEVVSLQVEEAALTGESLPVEKQTEPIPGDELPVGDRRNMVYAGTTVTYGRGRAVAVATGMRTEFGGIARLLQTVERSKTPLQLSLDKVGVTLARVAIGVVLVVVGLGLLRGQEFLEMLLFGTAVAVAVVPEALPAVITISLTLAAQRMVRRNALIRRLPATETLGSVSVICSDKTGTLTKGEMTARKIFVAGEMLDVSGAGYEPEGEYARDGSRVEPSAELIETLRAAVLASDALLVQDEADGQWRVRGDPTEGALVVAAAKAGVDKRDARRRLPARERDPLLVGDQALHDAPRDAAERARVREGRAGGDPRIVHATAVGHGRDGARRGRPASAPGCGAAAGGRGDARAGGRSPVRRHARDRRARDDLPRARRHDRPAAARGEGGGPDLQGGRHQGGDDHRRSSGHRAGHRARARHAHHRPCHHRRRARGDGRRGARQQGRGHRGLRPGVAGAQAARRHGIPEQGPLGRDDR